MSANDPKRTSSELTQGTFVLKIVLMVSLASAEMGKVTSRRVMWNGRESPATTETRESQGMRIPILPRGALVALITLFGVGLQSANADSGRITLTIYKGGFAISFQTETSYIRTRWIR
jgi:hypothetical protein